jgi:hypothetical protein
MHAFGLLSTHMAATVEYQKNSEQVLENFVLPEL